MKIKKAKDFFTAGERERIRQASLGAQGEAPDIRLIRSAGGDVRLNMLFREVCWDGSLGVMILAKIIPPA